MKGERSVPTDTAKLGCHIGCIQIGHPGNKIHYPKIAAIGRPVRLRYGVAQQIENALVLEAEVLTAAWRASNDPWDAINASSHWRKGGHPELGLSLTEDALAANPTSSPKIRSALATTRGGQISMLFTDWKAGPR